MLSEKECIPCQGGVDPLTEKEYSRFLTELDGWRVKDGHHLEKKFDFADFNTALNFVNQIGNLAESFGHHPNIEFSWGFVNVKIYTHKINGLHEADFILAAKIDKI